MESTVNYNRRQSDDEIDIGELFKILKRYKISIIVLTIIITLSASVYAYFAQNIYEAFATLEVKSGKSKSEKDFLAEALGKQSGNVQNEIEIIRSRWIISQAVESLNLNVRYFTTKNFKKQELYKNSPYVVVPEYISDKITHPIIISTKDKDGFFLSLKPTFKEKMIFNIKNTLGLVSEDDKLIYYNEYHKYGEKIVSPWFKLSVQKVFEPEYEKYTFLVESDVAIYNKIAQNLMVSTTSKESSILILSAEDTSPLRAKEIINAITTTYISANLDSKMLSASSTLKFLDKQLAAINKTLQKSASSLQKYKTTNVVINVAAKAQLTAGKLAELESQRYELDMKLNVLQNTYEFVQNNDDLSGIDLGSNAISSPLISSLIVKIQEAKVMRNSLLIDYTELHPDIIKISEKLISLKSTLISSIKSSINSLKRRRTTLSRFIQENTESLESLPQQEKDLARLNRNFLVNEKIYSFLLQKRAETAIIESSTVSGTRVLDRAVLIDNPIKPKRVLIVLVGFILGLILSSALAFFRNYRNNVILSVEDIEKNSVIGLYGALPKKSGKKSLQQFLEAMRVIRTNLEFVKTVDTSKLITITSSVPAEGKTTISTELAKIIASSHKKVLLIDLDMRRARMQEEFKMDNKIGMSTLLSGRNTLNEVVLNSEFENLQVITAGPTPPNPSELIMSDGFKVIIDNLRQKYDYVILDSPPIGLVTDAMMLMKMSDVNLFVFKAKFSKKDYIENINRMVSEHNLENAGFILNGLDSNSQSGYGYGYGHGYGQEHDYYRVVK